MQDGGGGHRFMKVFHKIPVFFKQWLPLVCEYYTNLCPSSLVNFSKNVNLCPSLLVNFSNNVNLVKGTFIICRLRKSNPQTTVNMSARLYNNLKVDKKGGEWTKLDKSDSWYEGHLLYFNSHLISQDCHISVSACIASILKIDKTDSDFLAKV